MSRNNRTEQQAADQKLMTGLKSHLTTPLDLGGVSTTEAQLGSVLQGRIDARSASDVAAAAYHKAVAAEADQTAKSKVLLAQARAMLLVMFASSPETLAAMGLSARKNTVKSVEVKAGAIEKAAATRKARNTMGPKAKLKVTGLTVGLGATGTAVGTAAAATAPVAAPIATGHTAP